MSGSEREPSGSEADRAGRRSKAQPGECCVSPNEVRVSSERSERNVGECSERSERNGACRGQSSKGPGERLNGVNVVNEVGYG